MTSFIFLLLAAAPDFELVEEVDGIRVESRAHQGSQFVDLRLSTTSSAPVSKLCDAAFGDGKIPRDEHTVRSRKVLSDTGDERITYEQVRAPIVSDRDFALKWTRKLSGDRCIVRFVITDAAVPVDPKIVRLTEISGEWTFTASANGKTRVQYVSHSEPGGGLPPFLVEGPRRATELDVVRRTIARAQGR